MTDKLYAIKERYLHLEEQMSDPEVNTNMDKFTKISKEYKNLQPLVLAFDRFNEINTQLEGAKQILKEEKDPEMRELAQLECEELQPQLDSVEAALKILLIPKDPEDSKDVIFEIRSGTGGDEASIFAGDLFRMYTRYFEAKGLKYEIISENSGDSGGFSKIVMEVYGENVFGRLRFESGAHRVQRVPKTESQGRVHTSAATVAVIPKVEIEDIEINPADLRVDTFRASGAGGQHVNKTESGVRFTHIPTGIVSESTESRSQIKNREIALQRLYTKIVDTQRTQQENIQAAHRRSLVGSGDRSDKIRTYNYPQNRITDHRINLTLYNLDRVMEGDLDGILDALVMFDNAEKMKGGEE
ncbi:MAG: peptide chain release factor 1 [Saprospiraceae bacterium]|nr:peptide chain release factor 1 [Saprospiraceae bacterium]